MPLDLEQLKAKVPAAFAPLVNQYGPAFASMAATEVASWIDLVSKGDLYAAHRAVLAKLPSAELLAAWDENAEAWKQANAKNSQRVQLQQEALAAVMRVLLTIAIAAVGL